MHQAEVRAALYRIDHLSPGHLGLLATCQRPPASILGLAEAGVHLELLNAAMVVAPKALASYRLFTAYAIHQVFVDVPFEQADGATAIVPLTPTGSIDEALISCCLQTREEKPALAPPMVVIYEDVPYIVDSVATDMTPRTPLAQSVGKTYADCAPSGIHLDMNQQLWRAKQARSKPSAHTRSPTIKKRTYVHLIPQLCIGHPLPYAIWVEIKRTPSVLYRWYRATVDASFQARWQWQHSVSLALTAPSALEGANHDRLAFLGDAVLKLVITVDTLQNTGWVVPETAKSHRLRRLQNSHLASMAQDLGLAAYVDVTGFRDSWCMALTTPPPCPNLSERMLATVVEALLGAAYEADGVEGSMTLARFLGLVAGSAIDLNLNSLEPPSVPSEATWCLDHLNWTFRDMAAEAWVRAVVVDDVEMPARDGLRLLGEAVQYLALAVSLYTAGLEPSDMTRVRHGVTRQTIAGLVLNRGLDVHRKARTMSHLVALGLSWEAVVGVIAVDGGIPAAMQFATAFTASLVTPLLPPAPSARKPVQ
ncbi:hypothetical protein ACHHYP_14550 [Achlya hypogyna]|uniref:RNase III domain-containing protein n=1 Tax=Achlya hypogyna TaxID=1202772 RepID=A0A1V9YCX5_ACHHY|nr:hypothetical protein ACHHYP_14550 [Achlya hypogyna]